MKKKLLYSLLLGLWAIPAAWGADYGLPATIQQGNILHCFNWPAKEVKAALPQIAAAGFGTVQLSPLQRPDVGIGSPWHDLYRPYDLAFKPSAYCSEQDLKDLCAAAKEYGIKVIVDVVANHVDKTAGYHDTWWDSNGRQRDYGGINYGDRNSITHGNLGDYKDVNSESAEVAARGKAYVEKLKSLGVSGCRWDAAKHIGLPSEGCNFWSTVTSVPGMWHYGEILDNPGPNPAIIKEYGQYMSVTDNEYCNYAAKSNGGIPGGHGGSWDVNYGLGDKVVYWAESHDTYSNDEWSQNVDQATIDRAYAAYACRNGATALYLSRPNTKGFSNIKVGKGSTAFTAKHIAEVNKFRNTMVGKADWFESNGNACSITRKDGGAVIVMKGSGNVSITNGGGYCPAGTYKDRVNGGTFTVTASTISGNVGSSGIAVIYADGVTPSPTPDPTPGPTPDPTPAGSYYILGNIDGAQWTTTGGATLTSDGSNYVAKGVKLSAAAGETACYFNITDALGADWDELNMTANRYGAATEGVTITLGASTPVVKYANGVDASGCLSWAIPAGTYDFTFNPAALTLVVVNAGSNPDPNPTPDPDPTPGPTPTPTPGTLTITGDYNLAYNGSLEKVYYWGGASKPEWPGETMATAVGSDGNTYKVFKVPEGTTNVIFATNGDGDKTADLDYTGAYVMDNNGATSIAVKFDNGNNPNPNPNPDPVPTPDPTPGDAHYIYYDGTFSTPTVWAWTSTANCNANGAWPGDAMTKKDGKWYWELPAGKDLPEQVIISENGGEKIGGGDLVYADKNTYHQDGTYSLSSDPNPNPGPTPGPTPEGSYYILGNIEGAQWTTDNGAAMTAEGNAFVAKNVKLSAAAEETSCYFNITDALAADWDTLNMTANRYGAATEGEAITLGSPASVVKYANGVDASGCLSWTLPAGSYDFTFDPSALTLTVVNAGNDPIPTPVKPVVTANPAGGTTFTADYLNVTLTVSPEATIYYTIDGSNPTTSSTKYVSPIAVVETTTIKTLAVTADGEENAQSFTYTKRSNDDPEPTPGPSGDNLITDYYKVNPNGQVGTRRTVNVTGHPATNAFSNWSASDLIAQGVARDVCQAFKGVHERPIVDSYAIYAAYDNDNLYLGIQFVYTIWDLYGEGKQPGESKPYNMDGHMVLAFDLDPEKSFDGYINGAGPIWNEGAKGAKFNNGVDAVLMCSTKPGVGTPGFFIPTADGHASYDAAYCKTVPSGFWGYTDGLHPSIEHVWGQSDFSYDPELLKGNEGFVDLRSEIDDKAHTFYEFKLPLSLLGVTADYIQNHGIGFMYLDKYGTSPVGGTPYDPSFFDNVNGSYSQDPSSSLEKEDEDVITYAPARIGKLKATSAVESLPVENVESDVEPVYYNLQGARVANPSNGIYIVVRGNKVSKEFIK